MNNTRSKNSSREPNSQKQGIEDNVKYNASAKDLVENASLILETCKETTFPINSDLCCSSKDLTIESSPNHKFYGCRKKGFSTHLCETPCESFALPDDPIFSNSPLFTEEEKSPIDTTLADPWDICVVNLDCIDKPWLIETHEVITPYCDVESLLAFETEDIRYKSDPDVIDLSGESLYDDSILDLTNISGNNTPDDSKEENDVSENVFTSTPVKDSESSSEGISVVSTINIANNEISDVDISALKDHVLKALEEAIKQRSSMSNIDMKIQIVADLGKTSGKPSNKSTENQSVEVRINETVENESGQSFSSSKENYCISNPDVADNNATNVKSSNILYNNVSAFDINNDKHKTTLPAIAKTGENSEENLHSDKTEASSVIPKNHRNNKIRYIKPVRRNLRSVNSTSLLSHKAKSNCDQSFETPNEYSYKSKSNDSNIPLLSNSSKCVPDSKILRSRVTGSRESNRPKVENILNSDVHKSDTVTFRRKKRCRGTDEEITQGLTNEHPSELSESVSESVSQKNVEKSHTTRKAIKQVPKEDLVNDIVIIEDSELQDSDVEKRVTRRSIWNRTLLCQDNEHPSLNIQLPVSPPPAKRDYVTKALSKNKSDIKLYDLDLPGTVGINICAEQIGKRVTRRSQQNMEQNCTYQTNHNASDSDTCIIVEKSLDKSKRTNGRATVRKGYERQLDISDMSKMNGFSHTSQSDFDGDTSITGQLENSMRNRLRHGKLSNQHEEIIDTKDASGDISQKIIGFQKLQSDTDSDTGVVKRSFEKSNKNRGKSRKLSKQFNMNDELGDISQKNRTPQISQSDVDGDSSSAEQSRRSRGRPRKALQHYEGIIDVKDKTGDISAVESHISQTNAIPQISQSHDDGDSSNVEKSKRGRGRPRKTLQHYEGIIDVEGKTGDISVVETDISQMNATPQISQSHVNGDSRNIEQSRRSRRRPRKTLQHYEGTVLDVEGKTGDISAIETNISHMNPVSQISQSHVDGDSSNVEQSRRSRGRPSKTLHHYEGTIIDVEGKTCDISAVQTGRNEVEEVRTLRPRVSKSSHDSNVLTVSHSEEETTYKRILRARNQGQKANSNENILKRTRSTNSLSDTCTKVPPVPPRKRSVSANFDVKRKDEECFLHREENINKEPVHSRLLETSSICTDSKLVKSSRISFDLNASLNESRKKASTQLKGILKNVSHGDLGITNKSTHEDCIDDVPLLTRQDVLDEADDKKIESDQWKDNGITSEIKIVISPMEVKEEEGQATCFVGDSRLTSLESHPLKKSTRLSKISNEAHVNAEDSKSVIENNDTMRSIDDVELKDIKIEHEVYNLGDFVWAQIGKSPYWPGIVCSDPITNTFFNEVKFKRLSSQVFYHIRFFGDSGKRSWVSKHHIILYCSKQDLEMIANKLKSENKSYNCIKHYLVPTSYYTTRLKWTKGVEEIESLKSKPYNEIIEYLVSCYTASIEEKRKKRKLSMLAASSESESEDDGTIEMPRRKKFKSNRDGLVTAEEHIVGFDELSISVGASDTNISKGDKKLQRSSKGLNIVVATPKLEEDSMASQSTPEIIYENTEYCAVPKPRRSLRTVNKVNTTETELEHRAGSSKNVSELTLTEPITVECSGVSSSPICNEESADIKESTLENSSNAYKKQIDEVSEVESKKSSDSSTSSANTYSFEYQIELHRKNNLFNGLRNVKVCDYCMKQGDLYKCKGKCGLSYHMDCASKVTQPPSEKRLKKKERSPNKTKSRHTESSFELTRRRSGDCCTTRSQSQCQIVTVKSKHAVDTPKKDNFPDSFHEMSIAEQIDYGMKEVMSKFDNGSVYDVIDSSSEEGSVEPSKSKSQVLDSPSSFGGSEKSANKNTDLDELIEEEKSSDDLEVSMITDTASNPSIKHVTADSVEFSELDTPMDMTNVKCTYCRFDKDPPCFACGLEISKCGVVLRQKCSQSRCGRYYHLQCLKMWPQTQWSIGKWSKHNPSEDSFTCPAHTCHTCFSEELGSNAACRLPGDKLARCLLCPAAFHTTTFCVPAGTEIFGGSQIACPRHRSKPIQPINTIWCFICSEGGNLVCCDTCPTSVHPECQPVLFTDDDKYICEDCESGRFPLYDEIVWVKLGQYRWWPALVLFPNEVPENVRALKHQRGDFAVRFFGTHDHYWVNKARSFLFQEGDQGGSPGEMTRSKNKVYEIFGKAIEDAAHAYKLKKEFKLRREAECINSLKPPPYVKINKNKPVGNVKCMELDLSNATACECNPNNPHPCGPDSRCINRLLMTECDPDVCHAGIRCRNQSFQKRDYPPMVPYKTQGRGWGLKALAPIKMGQFVIEYVGELIDTEEYQRRIKKMHEKKEENYYFMTVDSDRMIDAGPKGNLSRFMNHSCNPNCVTQKWTVKGDTRVGLFAKCDIDTGSELTFNYNLEVVGQEKKICKCGAVNCSGYIGVKAKLDKPDKLQADSVSISTEARRSRKLTKKRMVAPSPLVPPCFICGRKKSDVTCNNKFCNKGYHLKCLDLEEVPEASKYTCPRHNCNICSNRTIRCCVKCTNSFCPSHSEGNVRHDKFLGFVCRLHDPAISSVELSTENETVRQKTSDKRQDRTSVKKTRKNKRKNRSINGVIKLSAKEREARRTMWRNQMREWRQKKKIKLMNVVKNSLAIKQMNRDQNQIAESVPSENNKVEVPQFPQTSAVHQENGTSNASEDITNLTSDANIASSTPAERIDRETMRSTKRRRAKPDCTDESAVSSTTSDESSIPKPPISKKSETTETISDVDKEDFVSSSPTKLANENSNESSDNDDSLSLYERLKKEKVVARRSRKWLRLDVNS